MCVGPGAWCHQGQTRWQMEMWQAKGSGALLLVDAHGDDARDALLFVSVGDPSFLFLDFALLTKRDGFGGRSSLHFHAGAGGERAISISEGFCLPLSR